MNQLHGGYYIGIIPEFFILKWYNLNLQFVPKEKPSIESLEKSVETSAERIHRLTGFDSGLCPACKKGRMQVKREIPRIWSSAKHLPSLLYQFAYDYHPLFFLHFHAKTGGYKPKILKQYRKSQGLSVMKLLFFEHH
ncbi:MAG: hypothetical protein U9N51_06870 [Bacteroidota bacterium]|nr:hypothetical protein [Bacteroidota bacterium]